MCTYQLDRDKQAETQAFFANMTDEQIAGEYPADVKQIFNLKVLEGRCHLII
jgi:hypothetical protein